MKTNVEKLKHYIDGVGEYYVATKPFKSDEVIECLEHYAHVYNKYDFEINLNVDMCNEKANMIKAQLYKLRQIQLLPKQEHEPDKEYTKRVIHYNEIQEDIRLLEVNLESAEIDLEIAQDSRNELLEKLAHNILMLEYQEEEYEW